MTFAESQGQNLALTVLCVPAMFARTRGAEFAPAFERVAQLNPALPETLKPRK